jgi:hypothetical protein
VEDLDRRAERPHREDLLFGEGVGRDDPKRVALQRADEGERRARAAAGVLDDGLAGAQPARALGAFDHRQRHAVLVGARGVRALELDHDLGHSRADEFAEPRDGRMADRRKDAARDGHERILLGALLPLHFLEAARRGPRCPRTWNRCVISVIASGMEHRMEAGYKQMDAMFAQAA